MSDELNLSNLFGDASSDNTGTSPLISPATSAAILGNMGTVVVAGAAGRAAEDIEASDVTLITVVIDDSGSMYGNEKAVVDGMNLLVDTFANSKERDSVLFAQWRFSDKIQVVHSYLPIPDVKRLTTADYQANGCSTRLYDAWCDALAANIAYAQSLRNSGTNVRSIVVVLTDGENNAGSRNVGDCARISADLLRSEQFILVFLGVGRGFQLVARAMGVPDGCFAETGSLGESQLRQLFRMVSQSAIRASQGKIQPGANAGFFTT